MADSFLAWMPFLEPTACTGQPMYQEMTIIHCEMLQNFKAIASSHNGRHAVDLEILMDPTLYATIMVACIHPTGGHKHELLEYENYGAIVVCCHKMPSMRTSWPCWKSLGLAKKISKEVFDHVIPQYVKTTIPMWNENWWEFEQCMDHMKSFMVYTKQQEKCELCHQWQGTHHRGHHDQHWPNACNCHWPHDNFVSRMEMSQWHQKMWSKFKKYFNKAFNEL